MESITQQQARYFERTLKYHREHADGELLFAYFGEIHQHLIKAFGANLDEILTRQDCSPKVTKRCYHITVESLQNIVKHSDHIITGEPDGHCKGVFLVSDVGDRFVFTTGNVVSNARVSQATDGLDLLQGLSPEEVKELYKTRIREGSISERGGAGLGFIDMTKKTGHPIQYHHDQLNDTSTFLILMMQVSKV